MNDDAKLTRFLKRMHEHLRIAPRPIVRVWQIGPNGTEYYAAHSEEEMKAYYHKLCGDEEYCVSDLSDHFEEVLDLDAEFDFDDDGTKSRTTWRKLAESAKLPAQISTGYN